MPVIVDERRSPSTSAKQFLEQVKVSNICTTSKYIKLNESD